MLKWLMARLAERKKYRANHRKQTALHASLRPEVLEDRLAPAVAQWADVPPTNNWSDLMKRPWVGAFAPGAADTAVFARTASNPYLSENVNIRTLIIRSLGGAGAYSTNLDLNGHDLTATSITSVIAGTAGATGLSSFGRGKAGDAVFVVENSDQMTRPTLRVCSEIFPLENGYRNPRGGHFGQVFICISV